jgi:hypothetical protein
MITNALWYVTNQTLHADLKVPLIKDVIQENRINHQDKLGNHDLWMGSLSQKKYWFSYTPSNVTHIIVFRTKPNKSLIVQESQAISVV